MEKSTLKNKIHSLVDGSDEETFNPFNEAEYTDEFKNILNEELADYEKSKQGISKVEMDKLVNQAIKN